MIFSSSELSLRQSSQQDSSTSAAAQKGTIHKLPPPLTSLHRCEYEQLSKEAISTLCAEVFAKGVIAMSADEAMYLEECTRLQAQSLLWFEHQIGRITASKFLRVSQASLTSPSSSLVKLIMEQSNSPCLAPAIQWGINYEDNARKEYIAKASEEHENFTCAMARLHVLPSCPHLGASPDGMIACECCREGLIEIKCTYKYRDVDPNGIHDPSFYLKQSETGHLQLSRTHQCYHQVQAQLALCEKEFCDFICWTPHGMYIERILLDPSYLTKTKPKLDAFFVKVILPLLLTGCIVFVM